MAIISPAYQLVLPSLIVKVLSPIATEALRDDQVGVLGVPCN